MAQLPYIYSPQCFNNPDLVSGDWITQLYECSFVDGTCPREIPGIIKMTRGVDITRMDLLPIERGTVERGFRNQVIDFTCDGPTKELFGKEYDSPGQVRLPGRTTTSFLSCPDVPYKPLNDIKTHENNIFLFMRQFKLDL